MTGKASGSMSRLAARGAAAQAVTERVVLIPLEKIKFDPSQPRRAFHTLDGGVSEEATDYIDELAISIEEHGLIEPITVREQEDGSFLVVVGECRTRAHLKLGKTTIRATVRNDLIDHAKRLQYQIAENVNRMNLTDGELAVSVRWLYEFGNDGKPMKQIEIARKFGKEKRPDWVTTYLTYGDEEVQRVWVKSGIASGPSGAYLLSRLPAPQQMDILRRVNLPVDDREYLPKPVTRPILDGYRDEAKRVKYAEAARAVAGGANNEPIVNGGVGVGAPVGNAGADGDVVPQNRLAAGAGEGGQPDPIAQAIQEQYEAEKHERELASGNTEVSRGSEVPQKPTYKLDDAARARIQADALGVAGSMDKIDSKDLGRAPVSCRISAENVMGLLKLLSEDSELLDQAKGIRCDVTIPAGLAGSIANKLAGVVVDERELNSLVQVELGRLG